MIQAAGTTPKPLVDVDQIMERLERLQIVASEVRDKAIAIKSPPGCTGRGEVPCPPDASGRIILAIDNVYDTVVDARDSLKAFI